MKKIFCLTILAVLCTFGVASAQQFPSVQIETQDGKTIDSGHHLLLVHHLQALHQGA